MGDEIKATYTAVAEHFCATNPTMPSLRSTRELMSIPGTHASSLNALMLDNFAMEIDEALRAYGVRFPVKVRDLLLCLLPSDIPSNPCVEVYTVGREDPRAELVGEKGVRSTTRLQCGSFIGVYRGEVMLQSIFKKWRLSPPRGRHPIAHEIAIDSYAATTTLYNLGEWAQAMGIRFPGMSLTRPQDNAVVISAAKYGNITSVINDPHLRPMDDSDESLGENVDMFEIILGAWPFFVMFTTKEIGPGEDLRYNYGAAFWDYMQEHAYRSRNWDAWKQS